MITKSTKRSIAATATLATLETFLKALPEAYPNDRTTPGLSVAFLENGKFYASVCRYEGYGGRDKTVLTKSLGDTLQEALNGLAGSWIQKTEHIDRLKAMVRRAA